MNLAPNSKNENKTKHHLFQLLVPKSELHRQSPPIYHHIRLDVSGVP